MSLSLTKLEDDYELLEEEQYNQTHLAYLAETYNDSYGDVKKLRDLAKQSNYPEEYNSMIDAVVQAGTNYLSMQGLTLLHKPMSLTLTNLEEDYDLLQEQPQNQNHLAFLAETYNERHEDVKFLRRLVNQSNAPDKYNGMLDAVVQAATAYKSMHGGSRRRKTRRSKRSMRNRRKSKRNRRR